MAYVGEYELFSELDDLFPSNEYSVKDLFNDKNIDDFDRIGVPDAGNEMLAVDSENNILANPMVDLFGNHSEDLIESQPDFTNFCSETLMPVFLSADTSTAPSSVASASQEESTALPTVSSVSSVHTTENTSDFSSGKNRKLSEPRSNGSPVRIIIKTSNKSKNMVAPLSLPTPSYNLVKVPKVESLSQNRLRAIRAGGKLGTRRTTNVNLCTSIVTTVRTPPIQNLSTPDRIPSPEPSSSQSQERHLYRENLPFRSQRKRNISETSLSSTASSVPTKVKAYELEPLSDPTLERCRKNALNAKLNRDTKKKHMAELERRVENVSRERDTLAEENENLRDAKIKLEQQVKHLNNILKNQSKLATLLGKLDPSKVSIDLSTQSGNEVISSGMCLHMDGYETTIKYCSYCAKKNGE